MSQATDWYECLTCHRMFKHLGDKLPHEAFEHIHSPEIDQRLRSQLLEQENDGRRQQL